MTEKNLIDYSKGDEEMEEEKHPITLLQEMTKKLIAQVMEESDLKAISPEMIKEIRECVLSTQQYSA